MTRLALVSAREDEGGWEDEGACKSDGVLIVRKPLGRNGDVGLTGLGMVV